MHLNHITYNIIRYINTLFLLTFISFTTNAGQLGDFEKDISTNSQKQKANTKKNTCNKCNTHNKRSSSDDFFDHLFGNLIDSVFDSDDKERNKNRSTDIIVITDEGILSQAGDTSDLRISDQAHKSGLQKRKPGEHLIPFFRLNANTQHVSEKIDAIDLKLELGEGSSGFELRSTKYQERAINEKLEYTQIQYYYRMSFGNDLGVNLGIGRGLINGNEQIYGDLYSIPVLFRANKHISFELRPSQFKQNNQILIREKDISILFTYRKIAFRSGYRVIESSNYDIDGYYIGMDFIF